MSQEIIKVLEYLGEKLGIAIDWTAENILPYAESLFKRYVTLKITYASIEIVIGIVFAVVATVLSVKLVKAYNQMKTTKVSNTFWCIEKGRYCDNWDFTVVGGVTTFMAALCAVIALISLTICIPNLIEWIIIPEIPFAKEVASLLNTKI